MRYSWHAHLMANVALDYYACSNSPNNAPHSHTHTAKANRLQILVELGFSDSLPGHQELIG